MKSTKNIGKNCQEQLFFRTLKINQRFTTIWEKIYEKQISESVRTARFVAFWLALTPSPLSQLCGNLENQECAIIVNINSLVGTRGVRMELELFQNPVLRELSFCDLSGSFLVNPTQKSYLYVTWLGTCHVQTVFSSELCVKNNQQLFNNIATWGTNNNWGKQQTNQKIKTKSWRMRHTWDALKRCDIFLGI